MKQGNAYTTNQSFALLLVGEQKTGKTNVAMSFPNPWFLDIDRNISRAARVSASKKWFYDDPYTDDKGIEIPEVDRWNHSMKLIKAAASAKEVETIVIDSLGGLCDMLILHLMNEVKKSEGKSIDRLRIQDYQPLKTLLTKLVIGLRTTGKLIVITSHQKADKDELTGRFRYTLNIPGSSSENYGGFFSDVWATSASPAGAGKYKYELHTRPTGFHINLGTTLDIDPVLDITNKDPQLIWTLLEPKIFPKK